MKACTQVEGSVGGEVLSDMAIDGETRHDVEMLRIGTVWVRVFAVE